MTEETNTAPETITKKIGDDLVDSVTNFVTDTSPWDDIESSKDKLGRYVIEDAESYEYPTGLGDGVDFIHSVRFFIQARENSKVAQLSNLARTGSTTGLDADGNKLDGALETQDTSEQNRKTSEESETIAKVAGGLAGGVLAKKGLEYFVPAASGLATNVVAPVIGFGVGYGVAAGIVETVNTVRLEASIHLYITQPPIVKYSANWENVELGGAAGLGGGDATGISGLLQGTAGAMELGLRGAIKAAANLPGELGVTGELGASLDLASRKTVNPYKEQLFKSIGFRQFAFNYKFTPRNKTEYENVKKIIDTFKYHMHPENDPTGLFLEYPSEFEIEYQYKGNRNEHLNRISNCALTDMKVTYGNQDAFTSIKDENGAPAEINLELAFSELETLTNDRIADGF